MDQQKRREEIEQKRARLAELKRQRELRNQEIRSTRQSTTETELIQPVPSHAARTREIDELVNSVLGDSRPSSTGPRLSGSPARADSRSRPGSVFGGSQALGGDRSASGQRVSDGSGGHLDIQRRASSHSGTQYSTTATQTLSSESTTAVFEAPVAPKRDVETYSKAVQTEEWEPRRSTTDSGDMAEDDWAGEQKVHSDRNQAEILTKLRKEVEQELRQALEVDADNKAPHDDKFPVRVLNTEEMEAVTASEDFMMFIGQSTKVIERALDEPYDLLTDYAEGKLRVGDEEDGYRGRRGRRVKETVQYYDERWSKKRMISDIGFSPKYPELLLASYTKNPSAPHEPAGIIQVWNSHMPSRPEYVFHASSDILTAKFSPFHPSYVVGGCYSGQVLVWDTRSKSHSPVQKTPLTGGGHHHPVYSIEIVGTQNANNIISCSTDGVVCTWSIDMLAQPQEFLELLAPPPAKTEDVAPLCIAFPHSDPTYFLSGTEDGTIFACHRYERAGAKAGVDNRIRYQGHTAPVTSLDFHPTKGPVDLGDLVLSASMDWTVKLWRVRPPAATGGPASGATTVQGPIHEFPRDDLVYDAKWSPVRPGVFALVDGRGVLEVWDINADMEVPVAEVIPSERSGHSWAKRSLNRCAWEPNEGKKIAVGGLDGVVTIFEVGNELGGLEGNKNEAWSQVKKVVGRAEAQVGARATVNGR